MIVVTREDCFQLVTQPEHAHLAARILQLFKHPGVRERKNYEELLYAVREHDNGWQELDSAPRWDPERSRPFDFLTLPADERQEVWRRGSSRHLADHPYASALIMHHAWHLHTRVPLPETTTSKTSAAIENPISTLARELAQLRDETLAGNGFEFDELLEDYDFLELVDLISLVACSEWQRPFGLVTRSGSFDFELVRTAARGETAVLEIDPFPLAGTTTFTYRARTIERRAFSGDTELAVALLSSPSFEIALKIAPKAPR